MYLSHKRVNDELNQLTGYTLNAFLNDVVAILIFHTGDDVSVQFLDDNGLLVAVNHLKSLAHNETRVSTDI